MSYTIELPVIGPAFQHFEVKAWSVAVGDEIKAGDTLCELLVVPDHRYSKVSWRKRRELKKSGISSTAVERARVVVYSREPGELLRIDVLPGQNIQPGGTLGAVSNAAGGHGKFAIAAEVAKDSPNV